MPVLLHRLFLRQTVHSCLPTFASASVALCTDLDKDRGQHLGIGVPNLNGCKGAYSTLSVSPTGHGHGPVAFCRICLEAKAMPPDPPEFPWLLVWRARMGADESDRLISPCACTGGLSFLP